MDNIYLFECVCVDINDSVIHDNSCSVCSPCPYAPAKHPGRPRGVCSLRGRLDVWPRHPLLLHFHALLVHLLVPANLQGVQVRFPLAMRWRYCFLCVL